ncbi:hypothetical protein [Streptomyces sp. NPDC057336]|uniref:hypothetical protein n=1 Tax=Streptomyces sp. NPDC057336 TaxID=3346102 RepID=UPI00362804B9
MTPKHPKTELDARHSAALDPRPGAEDVTAAERAEAERRLRAAEVVVEGTAERLTDRDRVASPEGPFHGFGDSVREGDDLLFAVAPGTAHGFGHDGQVFSHTRYTFT